MKVRFTKMQGAGNDFVVLDATRAPLALDANAMRRLGDRRFGVGADQILVVEKSTDAQADFAYRIFNGASGDEVEHCGNGARCFVHFVRNKGLTDKRTLRVKTVNNLLELRLQADGGVTVDMNSPVFELARIPFVAPHAKPRRLVQAELWPLDLGGTTVFVAVLSMGNPHAVQVVDNVDTAPVAVQGPLIEHHASFPRRVNAGFMQVVSRSHIRLRVYERDAGETLSCGTGACAAVVAGIRMGLLDARVDVDTRGGRLTIEWPGGQGDSGADNDNHVLMTGPATTVFEGEIEL
ncbi:MAG: diaminopimelate epimerase [Methylibium sp. NZG]|nr:MAG: diaminopimelate epimerase [Methylibium sp. NZG]